MDLFAIPEHAIDAFERLTRMRVTVHDLAGTLMPFLTPERFRHNHSLCRAVKVKHDACCVDFEVTRLRREISSLPEGRVHVCFMGLVECVVPVFKNRELEWVLFAGPRRAASRLTAVRDTTVPPRPSPWPANTTLPEPIDDGEAQAVLESLRQLAARLKNWSVGLPTSDISKTHRPTGGPLVENLAVRRTVIRRFIFQRHTRPVRLADLAKWLHLSESRTGHIVKEACGQTFPQLLNEARLRTAAEMLQHTNLSISEIALRSGFEELAHFHRIFRARFKTTPRKYRISAESISDER